MSNEFLFSFLQPKYKKLADVAEALEKQVYNDVPSALSKARLFAEKLAKYVMEMEDIQVYYEMKHVEVVHKLYREGILNEEMHFRFEWIRKMGNKAVIEEKPSGGNPHANLQQTNPKQNPTNNKIQRENTHNKNPKRR